MEIENTISNDNFLLTIVIPCFNSSKTIARALDSLVEQVDAPPFKVIIQDDYSTDNFMDIVETYKSKLEIEYYLNVAREIHCPGNTRRDGLTHVDTEWVAFMDHDDQFEPDAFKNFKIAVDTNNEKNMVVSDFREYDAKDNVYVKGFYTRDNITWLHGKFFNMNFLKKYNITFKENLISHEDLYFNNACTAHIVGDKLDFSILSKFTYKWISNEESVSRSMFKEKEYYIDKFMVDYIRASVDPWLEVYEEHPEMKDHFFYRECYVLLFSYFYYQSAYDRNGFRHLRVNRDIFEDYLNEMRERYNVTNTDILNIVYSDNNAYNDTRMSAMNGCIVLMETTSFKDFINSF